MSNLLDPVNGKKEKDIRTLGLFVQVYCRQRHDGTRDTFEYRHLDSARCLPEGLLLCARCRDLLTHGITKLLLCLYDPKPMCKKCATQCYHPGYREEIRGVMRFSGMYLIKHGRLDLLAHYFL
jgi:hypothetical protein